MRFSANYLLLILGVCLSPKLMAGISLSQAIVHFEEDGKRSEDIEIYNQGNETVYIRVEPSIVEKPGQESENRRVYKDPRKAGLLVTPQRLIIPAGTRKRLRLVRLDKPVSADENVIEQDKVYRVLVKPEVGEVSAEQTAVKVIVAYEVLVLSQPKNANAKIVHEFADKKLFVKNTGNTNLLLQKGFQCPKDQTIEDENNGCIELSGKRLYAGAEWAVDLVFDTPVYYQYSVGLDNRSITFTPENKK